MEVLVEWGRWGRVVGGAGVGAGFRWMLVEVVVEAMARVLANRGNLTPELL
jgi:hypothetical protein